MFDKKQFALLLKKAIGNNSIRNFASQANIDRSHLSKHLNKKFPTPYQPEKLQRIADASEGRVTYEELMMASGYIKNENEILLQNIKLIIGNMSYEEFSKDVGKRLNDDRFTESYSPSYLNDIFTGRIKIEPMRVLSLANYAGVDETFFYKENTSEDLMLAQRQYKEKIERYNKLHSIANKYYISVNELQENGYDMNKYIVLFEKDNIKYLDEALQCLEIHNDETP